MLQNEFIEDVAFRALVGRSIRKMQTKGLRIFIG